MSKLTTYLQSELTDCTAGSPVVKLVEAIASAAMGGAGASPVSIGKMCNESCAPEKERKSHKNKRAK